MYLKGNLGLVKLGYVKFLRSSEVRIVQFVNNKILWIVILKVLMQDDGWDEIQFDQIRRNKMNDLVE